MRLPLLSSFLLALTLISCTEKEKEPVVLSCNPSELSFDWEYATKTVTITTDVNPTISSRAAWIKVTKSELSNNLVTMTVTVDKNETADDRTGDVNIIGNKQSIIFKVTQGVEPVEFNIQTTSASFDCEGGEQIINITSSKQPKISSDASWLGASVGTVGKDKKADIRLFAAINTTDKARSAKVTVECGTIKKTIEVKQDALSINTADTKAVTIEEFYEKFGLGWNLGNHFDAVNNGISSETAWGNPKATQATFDKVKAAGINTVRMPVTWSGHIGEAPEYKIEEKWLDRVAEVVGYCEKAGLNVIINTHHDDDPESGWLNIKKAYKNTSDQKQILEEFVQVWHQIALKFKDKGDWLIMEPYNEIQDGGWGWSSDFQSNPQKQYNCVNEWLQGFVKAVRMTGGENATRWLSAPGYSANIQFTINGLKIPTDYTSNNRLAIAVHFYDPTNYTLENKFSEWGHTADKSKKESWGDEDNTIKNLDQVKDNFQAKGYPVYFGEFGCTFRTEERDIQFHKYYIEYTVKAMHGYNTPMIVWDNGTDGGGKEHHGYFDHGTGAFKGYAEDVINLMVKAAHDTNPDYTLESVYNSAPAKE